MIQYHQLTMNREDQNTMQHTSRQMFNNCSTNHKNDMQTHWRKWHSTSELVQEIYTDDRCESPQTRPRLNEKDTVTTFDAPEICRIVSEDVEENLQTHQNAYLNEVCQKKENSKKRIIMNDQVAPKKRRATINIVPDPSPERLAPQKRLKQSPAPVMDTKVMPPTDEEISSFWDILDPTNATRADQLFWDEIFSPESSSSPSEVPEEKPKHPKIRWDPRTRGKVLVRNSSSSENQQEEEGAEETSKYRNQEHGNTTGNEAIISNVSTELERDDFTEQEDITEGEGQRIPSEIESSKRALSALRRTFLRLQTKEKSSIVTPQRFQVSLNDEQNRNDSQLFQGTPHKESVGQTVGVRVSCGSVPSRRRPSSVSIARAA